MSFFDRRKLSRVVSKGSGWGGREFKRWFNCQNQRFLRFQKFKPRVQIGLRKKVIFDRMNANQGKETKWREGIGVKGG